MRPHTPAHPLLSKSTHPAPPLTLSTQARPHPPLCRPPQDPQDRAGHAIDRQRVVGDVPPHQLPRGLDHGVRPVSS